MQACVHALTQPRHDDDAFVASTAFSHHPCHGPHIFFLFLFAPHIAIAIAINVVELSFRLLVFLSAALQHSVT
jgi:hypothetical protein